jgi:hypothetical protein
MKSVFFIILLAIIALSACNNSFLNTAPLDSYSNSSLWKTENDAMSALSGCYSGWEYGDNVVYNDCMSDNAYDQFPWEGYETFASGLSTPSNPGVNQYNYITIQRCNWFLDNIDKVPSSSLDDSLRLRMKAEARFLRAYRYFIMSQCYGDIPFALHAITPADANVLKRTPKDSITNFVLNELTEIAPALPVSYAGSDIGRITRGAALALKARVELYNGDYTDCVATCNQLMTTPFNYSLYPSYSDLFRPQNVDSPNNHEVILDVQYVMNLNSEWVLIVLAPNSYGGWSSVAATQSLVDAYECTDGNPINMSPLYDHNQPYQNRDPRLDASIIRPGSLYMGKYFDPLDKSSTDVMGGNNCSPTGYNFKKYIENLDDYSNTTYGTDFTNSGGSIIVMRYAEVLLTYAEALIELNQDLPAAAAAINTVRARVGMPPVTATDQAGLRACVRNERRVELAGEGLRWYDIQRWKIEDQVMNGNVLGSDQGSVNTSTGALTLIPNSHVVVGIRQFATKNYLFPIPQSEIIIDKNLTQNPGY